ncbi:MAG TPA: thioredoxin-dependent thiol peroxidase [Nitrospiria bacterium]|jgi:peroxiredoxin Q/BCP|nr:thioredoxin-dependent thiol peroxidase [Nitrospiria bacterium]
MAANELNVGDAAPDFRLPSTEGREISLKEFRGKKKVVLYFYPKDDTPGCTKEACSFRDERSKFDKEDAVILGVSFDDLESHKKFAGKFKLPFPLLSDADKKVAEAYGVYKEKSMYGRTYMGIERSTFVIDKDGKIARIYRKVKVDGHSDEILGALGT